jgi:hypothetical protein
LGHPVYGLLYFEYAFRWFYFVVDLYRLCSRLQVRSSGNILNILQSVQTGSAVVNI